MSTDMHGEVLSFEVEPDSEHIIMRVSDPSEGPMTVTVTVRVSKAQLATMADAQPFWSDGPPQTPTQPQKEN